MKKKIYIGGKISGLTVDEYRNNFENARKKVKENNPDAEIITPIDLCEDEWSWEKSMEVCVNALWDCDEIYLMDNWKDSKGAFIEWLIANKRNMKINFL